MSYAKLLFLPHPCPLLLGEGTPLLLIGEGVRG